MFSFEIRRRKGKRIWPYHFHSMIETGPLYLRYIYPSEKKMKKFTKWQQTSKLWRVYYNK